MISLLGCLVAACWQERPISSDEMIGTYKFIYPSGEVETLVIREDSTYRKDIYTSYNDFNQNSKPKYTDEGTWSIVHRNELKFNGWLMHNRLRYPDDILREPYTTTLLDVYWEKPTFKRKARISVYDETDYIFEKID